MSRHLKDTAFFGGVALALTGLGTWHIGAALLAAGLAFIVGAVLWHLGDGK